MLLTFRRCSSPPVLGSLAIMTGVIGVAQLLVGVYLYSRGVEVYDYNVDRDVAIGQGPGTEPWIRYDWNFLLWSGAALLNTIVCSLMYFGCQETLAALAAIYDKPLSGAFSCTKCRQFSAARRNRLLQQSAPCILVLAAIASVGGFIVSGLTASLLAVNTHYNLRSESRVPLCEWLQSDTECHCDEKVYIRGVVSCEEAFDTVYLVYLYATVLNGVAYLLITAIVLLGCIQKKIVSQPIYI